jgi:hypothetical protein
MSNTKKTIYLHIGLPKTGTTAIQIGLSRQHKELEKRGYAYPFAGETAHHNLAYELLAWESHFDPALCTFAKLQTYLEQTPHQNIIVSSEDFSALSPDNLQQLATHLQDHQVKIVIYLRRQDQLIQSTWSEIVKTGAVMTSFEDWFNGSVFDHVLPGEEFNGDLRYRRLQFMSSLHYDTYLSRYARIFGQDNILIRAYERSSMNTNIVADFLQLVGMDDVDWVSKNAVSNVSPGIKTLEFLRQLATAWQTKTSDHRFMLNSRYQQYFIRLGLIADQYGWNDHKLNLIDQTRYDQVVQIYGEGNKTVAQTYLGRDELFREPFTERPVTRFDVDKYTNDELIAMAQEMAVESLKTIKRQNGDISLLDSIRDIVKSSPRLKRWLQPVVRLWKHRA